MELDAAVTRKDPLVKILSYKETAGQVSMALTIEIFCGWVYEALWICKLSALVLS